MGTSSKTPFCFAQCGRSPSEWSSSPEHGQSNQAQVDQTSYCIWVRVTLGEWLKWTGSLIANIFQDGLEEWITKQWFWPLGRQSYFSDNDCSKRGFPRMMQGMLDLAWATQSIGLEGRLKWKWQWVLSWKVIEPLWMLSWEIKKWIIMGLSRGMLVLNIWVEVEDVVEDKVPHNYQETSSGSLSSGGGVQIGEASGVPINWPWLEGPERANMQEEQEEVWGWRAICKSTKDVVTYHSWWWDVAIFHHLGWDNQHLLPYIFWSLQGLPGDLASSIGKDATLNQHLADVGWAL